jgi:hypothetical protein
MNQHEARFVMNVMKDFADFFHFLSPTLVTGGDLGVR